MQKTTWCQAFSYLSSLLCLDPVIVLGHHFVLRLYRHKNASKLFTNGPPHLVERHRRNYQSLRTGKISLFHHNPVYGGRLVTLGVQVVQVLNMYEFGERYGDRIHSVVPMVISLRPILYLTNILTVGRCDRLDKPGGFELRHVQFLHDIYQAPFLPQSVSNGTSGAHHHAHIFKEYLASLLGDVLCVPQIAFNKALGNI